MLAIAGDPGPSSVGIVADRTVGNAVVRNKVRRRLREAIAATDPTPGFDIVVLTSREVIEAPFDQLVEWVRLAMPKEDQ